MNIWRSYLFNDDRDWSPLICLSFCLDEIFNIQCSPNSHSWRAQALPPLMTMACFHLFPRGLHKTLFGAFSLPAARITTLPCCTAKPLMHWWHWSYDQQPTKLINIWLLHLLFCCQCVRHHLEATNVARVVQLPEDGTRQLVASQSVVSRLLQKYRETGLYNDGPQSSGIG